MNDLDRRLMLLSSDWFMPHWGVIPLLVYAPDARRIQSCAREAVHSLMGTAKEYWGVDFSSTRLERTLKGFSDCLISTYKTECNEIISWVMGAEIEVDGEATTIWLLESITESWLSTECPTFVDDKVVFSRFIGAAQNWFELSIESDVDFESIQLASVAEWDRYLLNLTPDLPTYLSDYVQTEIKTPTGFRGFWLGIYKSFDMKERSLLVDWYVKAALELADPSFDLKIPKWMLK